jgi:hypothetical protein
MNAKKLRGIIVSARKIAEQYRMDGTGADHIVARTGVKRDQAFDLLIGNPYEKYIQKDNWLYKEILKTGNKKGLDKSKRVIRLFGNAIPVFEY